MQRLTPDTARSWRQMKHAASESGVDLLLVSGFRSIRYQVELFRKKLASGQHIDAILKVNAAPGFSEHHTGRAVDIATPGTRPLTEEFETSAAFEWLRKHAARFGFRMPYGRGNAFGIALRALALVATSARRNLKLRGAARDMANANASRRLLVFGHRRMRARVSRGRRGRGVDDSPISSSCRKATATSSSSRK